MTAVDARLGKRPGARWTSVAHGLHRPPGAVQGLHQDLLAWKLLLPGSGAFTHLTAAAERGWWLPPLPDVLPVFASIAAQDALLACARHLRLLDLVVLVDAALHLGHCSMAELQQLARSGRKGTPRLRQALAYADGRSESAWETLLRMLHVACGVPVEPQVVVEDEEGRFVARADLGIVGTQMLHEYDGADHLQRRRQRKDLARLRALGDAGWGRRGYTSMEVLHQANLILRDADLSLGRPHRPQRVQAWYDLLAEALFTPPGTTLFLRRLGVPAEGLPRTGRRRPVGDRAPGVL